MLIYLLLYFQGEPGMSEEEQKKLAQQYEEYQKKLEQQREEWVYMHNNIIVNIQQPQTAVMGLQYW